uniref:Uncharacterized protein n=1 Tax=Arundo donax TaxID=35708 RepID=A0A0A9BUC5_ARUDO
MRLIPHTVYLYMEYI